MHKVNLLLETLNPPNFQCKRHEREKSECPQLTRLMIESPAIIKCDSKPRAVLLTDIFGIFMCWSFDFNCC